MDVALSPGKYVIAVSGGVDSVVLLDMLSQQPSLELVVAHFDHGIRSDSAEDVRLVATLSQKYNILFELGEGQLGEHPSEAQAREARYDFLQQIRKKHQATGVVTAHHQDDAVETLALNVLRGTRRKGISALQSREGIVRPLLPYSKQQIKDYAAQHNLMWREDSTNQDQTYARNWLRRTLLPKLTSRQKRELVNTYTAAKSRNEQVDEALTQQLKELKHGTGLARQKFIALPYSVSCEVMVVWLQEQAIPGIDRKLVDQLVVSAKTLPPGKRVSLGKQTSMVIEAEQIRLD